MVESLNEYLARRNKANASADGAMVPMATELSRLIDDVVGEAESGQANPATPILILGALAAWYDAGMPSGRRGFRRAVEKATTLGRLYRTMDELEKALGDVPRT